MKWHMHAGGVSAASDRHGYTAHTKVGSYYIQPVSSKFNVERHVGYRVSFTNDQGYVGGIGLWFSLADYPVKLREAKQLCEKHFAEKGALPSVRETVLKYLAERSGGA